jgi:tetratricopeptide (TPR) repeat protein
MRAVECIHGSPARAVILFLALLFCLARPTRAEVKVWEGQMTLPTYEEGLPDENPPFDIFNTRSFITYPYTTRENLTDRRSDKTWRTLNLENEYLKVVVLPDLGGRLYSCVDKANGREMFYANPSIKYAQVAFRGAWVALGIEFNFPVSHNWVTVSPVDFGVVKNPDGSASVWVGNVDRVYRMTWRVALTLRPRSSLLEQTVTLYNGDGVRHRFYWWNTASVEVDDDSRIIYPMQFTASHGFKDVDTWPVDSEGYDLSVLKNHTRGYVSRFAHATREPFMGVYHPRTRSGVVHYAAHEEVPAKKIWSWGSDEEGKDWRAALSDNRSAYVEVQAGLFRNQETYAFLDPQQLLRFNEYYMPVREIGGFSRANLNGVVNVERRVARAGEGSELAVGLNVNREVRGGRLRIKLGDRVVSEEGFSLTPAEVFRKEYAGLTASAPYTVELVGPDGRTLLSHTEGAYDLTPKAEVKVGPTTSYLIPPAGERGEGDWVEQGKEDELNGRLLPAYDTYAEGLRRYPDSFELNKAAGRLAVGLKRYEEAVAELRKAQWRVNNDPEVHYYLGQALSRLGRNREARVEWEGAAVLPPYEAAALFELGRLASREGDARGALRLLEKSLKASPTIIKAGALEVALLRRQGETDEARARLRRWLEFDPPNSFLRHERIKLGETDDALWTHLAGDPERVLEVAADYMDAGLFEEALELLERKYPSAGVVGEPGAVLPQQYPLVAYYRGYCREQMGQSGVKDFQQASGQPTRYVFPNRPETMDVLRKALEANPRDATAHFLLGSLYLSGGMADPALREWEEARKSNPRIPILHRNLGLTLLHAKSDAAGALKALQEGQRYDGSNPDIYSGMDQAMSILRAGTGERIAALEKFPNMAALPPALVHKLALAFVEAGDFGKAEALYRDRFFPREEFGTNVRQVYLEIQLQKALALARAGRRVEAAAVAAGIGKEVPGLPFTRDGLAAFIGQARYQYYLGELESLLGDEQSARAHWQSAAAGENFRYMYFGYLAAKRLGAADERAWRERLEKALQASRDYLASGGHFPGLATYSQGLLLRALGRVKEADATLRKTLLYPDKAMAFYLTREALQGSPGEESRH